MVVFRVLCYVMVLSGGVDWGSCYDVLVLFTSKFKEVIAFNPSLG